MLHSAILLLNNCEYKGTLTFFTLKNIQKILIKNFNKKLTITEIFKSLGKHDMEVLSVFLIETFKTVNPLIDEIKIINDFSENLNLEGSIEKFKKIFEYINELLEECMPKAEVKESEFEDIPDIGQLKDWEFDYMEYLWETTLKRNDFWNITPNKFFSQMEIYKKINNIKDEKYEEI